MFILIIKKSSYKEDYKLKESCNKHIFDAFCYTLINYKKMLKIPFEKHNELLIY